MECIVAFQARKCSSFPFLQLSVLLLNRRLRLQPHGCMREGRSVVTGDDNNINTQCYYCIDGRDSATLAMVNILTIPTGGADVRIVA